MPDKGKKNQNVKILKEIYDSPNSDQELKRKETVKQYVKGHFSKPGVVDRWIAGGILFFGLAAVVLGFFQFRSNIYSYFKSDGGSEIGLDASNLHNPDDPDLLGLRQKDTDQDGLSDYDEIYVYQSSPYLNDTDSDGISDSDEIAAGSDPNCETGKDCFGTFDNANNSGSTGLEDLLLSGGLSGDQIRQLLVQAGVPQANLVDLSDADLFQLYQEVLVETDRGLNQGQVIVDLPVDDIQDLTPGQVRDLLEQEGIDRATLDGISDTELIDLVNETLITF